ncbi:MAG: helix-turn-helix transcriptional regulator [Actinomycetota bacterium]
MAGPDELKDEIEGRWRDLGEFIREQRSVGQLSLRKLSEQAGVSNPYLSQIERGLRRPSAEILRQIARALEISSEELYVRAGILDERDTRPDVVSEIRRDPHLSEDQKKTLIHIYGSFRGEVDDALSAVDDLDEPVGEADDGAEVVGESHDADADADVADGVA